MIAVQQQDNEADLAVCAAARNGELARYLQEYPEQAKESLYRLVNDLVYRQLTRKLEWRRGHRACAASVNRLAPECHDRHQDDVAAVLDDLLCHTNRRIENLPGWVVTRLTAATVNGYRRRRGERGALQRPRLPKWLDDRIDGDPWLRALCVEILTYVGVPDAVRQGLWPLGVWANLRAEITGETSGSGERTVANDVERVLAAMRAHPQWYELYIERPLGHKHAPLAMPVQVDEDLDNERLALQLVPPDEAEDARISNLAHVAIRTIENRLQRGEDTRTAVREVILTVFGYSADTEAMTQAPSAGVDAKEHLSKMMADPATIDRITAAVLAIVAAS